MYVQNGTVRLSFLSRAGAQRIVAVIDQGAFFGEGCLAGQPRRMVTATAVTACNVRFIDREEMVRQLHLSVSTVSDGTMIKIFEGPHSQIPAAEHLSEADRATPSSPVKPGFS